MPRPLRRIPQSMASPNSATSSLTATPNPRSRPPANGERRATTSALTAKATAWASLCDPATTAQMSTGLASTSSTALARARGSGPARKSASRPTTMKAAAFSRCSHITVVCVEAPEACEAAC